MIKKKLMSRTVNITHTKIGVVKTITLSICFYFFLFLDFNKVW